MKRRILSVIISIIMIVTTFAGCTGGSVTKDSKKKINKAQLVVAINPIFAYDNDDYSLAFNDIKNAAQSDSKEATLTSLTKSTNYSWAFRNNNTDDKVLLKGPLVFLKD